MNSAKEILLLAVVAATGFTSVPLTCAAEPGSLAQHKPNVLIIVTDDLGYHDLGFQGSSDIPTPNLDNLVKHGVRFTQAYVTAPICGASRAGLLSGRYQQRHSYESNPGPAQGLNVNEATIATAFHDAGYATGAFGKWSVGQLPQFRPLNRGFDEFFGFLGMMHPYVPGPVDPAVRMIGEPLRPGWGGDSPATRSARDSADAHPNFNRGPGTFPAGFGGGGVGGGGGNGVIGADAGHFVRNNKDVTEDNYATEAFAREAINFIDHHKGSPFFVYLAFNASHSPLQPTQKYLDRFPNLTGKHKLYAATTAAMDDAVGAVIEKLEQTGERDNTVIAFINDNGGPINDITANNSPLSGAKASMWEGGIRVASFFNWPGHLPEGVVVEQPIISLDYFPTLLAATGVPTPAGKQFEGRSLLPLINGQDTTSFQNRTLYWRMGNVWAIREGNWKLEIPQRNVKTPLLFNLADDIAETKDVAGDHPDVVAHLAEEWNAWNAKNLPAPAGFGGGIHKQAAIEK
ncbi:MAG TPA: sulfatase-like hydrolase/transferase [Phycisphaerae bacterium]|nr:sulfatase-like hydrolase/transferase [Phycisphaerae bacterium]